MVLSPSKSAIKCLKPSLDRIIKSFLTPASGSVACAVKEGVKLYFYNVRAAHVDRGRDLAIDAALEDALS
ncbi:hypothetical protein COLO4_28325 [Corchorus olitorius]|uniref:Uncharacterized protein n=1 Tax=Corchorus olitorius TaxID=93759 RepID=A0A1R3HLN3_9ROSI|nr:hypothetical protein COLO4_28325 [Corchorus olitorius]